MALQMGVVEALRGEDEDDVSDREKNGANGFMPLAITRNYYDDIEARFGLDPDFAERLRAANILYDRDEHGEYFQLYSPVYGEGFFFEIVERRGYRGYGAPNAIFRIAAQKRIPLNAEFFEKFVLPRIVLYDGVAAFLRKLKLLEDTALFKATGVKISFFIVTAGLKELVELVLPRDLITWTFGCRYKIVVSPDEKGEPESVPVFCMDETMKTRSLFEISKGSFSDKDHTVNRRVDDDALWAPFANMIYIGDGDTDVPALSLVRSRGGIGIAVYNPKKPKKDIDQRLKNMRLDKRADLITPAEFGPKGELFDYLTLRCRQIALRYRAEQSV